jgi:hypothetical protein
MSGPRAPAKKATSRTRGGRAARDGGGCTQKGCLSSSAPPEAHKSWLACHAGDGLGRAAARPQGGRSARGCGRRGRAVEPFGGATRRRRRGCEAALASENNEDEAAC